MHHNAGNDYTIGEQYIQIAASAGDAYDFNTTPVQITYNGGSPSASVTGDIVSDPIQFPFNGATDYVIATYMPDGYDFGSVFAPGGTVNWRKSGSNESSIVDVSGYVSLARADNVKEIEISP